MSAGKEFQKSSDRWMFPRREEGYVRRM